MTISPITNTPVAVTTSVTTLYTAPTGYFRDVVVTNGGTAVIYLGGSVMATTATQYLALPVNQSMLLCGQSENLYAITSAGTATAYVGLASVVSVI